MGTEGEGQADLVNVLSKLGLERYYPNKLTLHSLLEINKKSVYEESVVDTLDKVPWCFLRRLFKINAECRNAGTQLPNNGDDEEDMDPFDIDLYTAEKPGEDKKVHPLDVIVALFLCADSLLQQEMALKMSMCQFSVPLLLPHSDNSQCSLMVWALRDIVKEWCPHTLSESRGYEEDSVVQASMPFFSLFRLKNCSLSKSQVLNHILSLTQYNHMFMHRDMKGAGIPKKIANGMAEVCWYLPCGRENDTFPEPVAFANLRGDISQAVTQFTFLYEVSTTAFVFLDKVEEDERRILSSLGDVKSKLVFVVNRKEDNALENMMSVKATMEELGLPKSNVKIKAPGEAAAEFSDKLCQSIKKILTHGAKVVIEKMIDNAVELGLSVDETKTQAQKKAAADLVKGIGVKSIQGYKKDQLRLQGETWKDLSRLEAEECRLKNAGQQGIEEYKCSLQEEKTKAMEERMTYKLSSAMRVFIESSSEHDPKKRDVFLKWMKIKLHSHLQSVFHISLLRNQLKEQHSTKDKNAELDRALLDSSLGVEHYMREMGLIYEVSVQSSDTATQTFDLPALAAQMLLDGHPLELLDGDASNIPERWVTDVLTQLHNKVGGRSRLLVLTVLGVQSSGKSTLLNTMFGVQFPVSSGRCTRGAYMIFLKVGEDMQSTLGCDFVVLIDTEGLKSPHLAELEDSYEHDNQLATFVIGLSDVTVINIAMENSTEMRDVLQIAVHAFLRMKQIGKKPVCHFVHQNVGGVSAHAKTMVERQQLLDQLNEMTQIAAEMERQPSYEAFTDVLDYDIEKNNWNIPGLWHGTPPMAPVNTGYSEAVAHFKRSLLESVRRDSHDEVSKIPEFLEWVRSLWKAVKYENFIFSFRNTLVAKAYDNLCKEFIQWEWEFRKQVFSRQQAAEVDISNADSEAQLETWNSMAALKKTELTDEIKSQETTMKCKLHGYYRRKDRQVHLIEKHKMDFLNNISLLAKEITHSVNNKLDCAVELKRSSKTAREIQIKSRQVIEEQVMKLVAEFQHCLLNEQQLKNKFEDMWTLATKGVSGLKEQNISASVLRQLREHFLNRNVSDYWNTMADLQQIAKGSFKARTEHIRESQKLNNYFLRKNIKASLQNSAENTIEICKRHIHETVANNADYHDSFPKELLEKADKSLKNHKQSSHKFEFDLKLYVCALASEEFTGLHRKFLSEKDPRVQLDKYKPQYYATFMDLYKQTDHHCQRKANDFVQICIKPAVEEFINRSLGIAIVDEILSSSHSAKYSSRSFFQYNIQREILHQEKFESLLKYIGSYEIYVKDRIFDHIQQKMSEDKTLWKLKNQNLQVIMKKIREAIQRASRGKDGRQLPNDNGSISEFIKSMRTYLIKDISISADDEQVTLFQIQSKCHPFISDLTTSMEELMEQLQEEFSKSENIAETLYKLPVRPQDELFKRVFGCGHQCPFCKVPCEAGGVEHKKHHAAVHRPQGLAGYKDVSTKELVEAVCTTHVNSQCEFRNPDTNQEFLLHKDYAAFYPDWHIPPDSSTEASDYWKYVLVKYNHRFAEKHTAKPAVVPNAWRGISKEQALKALKNAYNMK